MSDDVTQKEQILARDLQKQKDYWNLCGGNLLQKNEKDLSPWTVCETALGTLGLKLYSTGHLGASKYRPAID